MESPLESLSLTPLTAQLTHCESSWAESGRRVFSDSFNRIYWLADGEAQIEHNGSLHTLRRGQLHVIPANSPGRYRCVADMNLHWCHFNAKLLGGLELYDCAKFALDARIPRSRWKQMDSLWLRFEKLDRRKTPKARIESAGILHCLLAEMAPSKEEDAWFAMGRFERFKEVFKRIESSRRRRIKVGELAKIAGLQENYFTGLFKETFGIAPMPYVKRQRLRHAQTLLKGSSKSLKEIALECGFGSESHFSAAFKKETGAPPGVYRSSSAHELR